MSDTTTRTADRVSRRAVHAVRIPTPQACGCGMPVAYDMERHAFFCIGCGAFRECTCRKSAFGSTVRPVNVA